ncbi:MAG: PEP-CTERM sorting domain-containing protein [Limnoraphis sp. WC205]|nr:PEP-CTERM sorting domain-containing protein [Limnoraphis sp. WC205]
MEQILFKEQSIPGKSVPEPASILGLLTVGILGASSKLKRKSRS